MAPRQDELLLIRVFRAENKPRRQRVEMQRVSFHLIFKKKQHRIKSTTREGFFSNNLLLRNKVQFFSVSNNKNNSCRKEAKNQQMNGTRRQIQQRLMETGSSSLQPSTRVRKSICCWTADEPQQLLPDWYGLTVDEVNQLRACGEPRV